MIANFILQVENNSPVWPAYDREDGTRVLEYCGCIGPGPVVGTWLGQISTLTDAAMDALKLDPRFAWVEDIIPEVLP